jgi:Na+/proline symporter/signal transduction histidine kinase
MSIDIFIVIIFLILTLVVGLGHGQNVKSIKDYALGGRNFSTGALVATIVATYASGSLFFSALAKTYIEGLFYSFATIGISVSMLISSFVLIPRMGEFLGKISIAEAMGDLYGDKVRLITAIAGTIGSAGSIAVQFKVFGNVVSYFIGIPSTIAIIISGTIATTYSAFGGVKSVTFTDILQGFAFGVIIPLLGFVMWSEFYHTEHTITSALSDQKFSLDFLFDISSDNFWNFILLFIIFTLPSLNAPDFQRISMGSNIGQVKKAFLIASIIFLVITFAITWIPFILHAINPNVESDQLLPYVIDTFSFTGLKGLIIVAIIAFAMSTADSKINATSVLFSHDIYGLLVKDKKNELLAAKIFALILGFGTIVLSLIETDLLSIIIFTGSFYFPVIVPSFLLAILGFRSSTKSVLIGMCSGLIVTTIWKFLPDGFLPISQNIIGFLFATLCNIIFFFTSHYLLRQKGGWIGIKDTTYLEEQRFVKQQRITKSNKWLNDFSVRSFCQKIAPHNDITYTTLGLYFIVCTITTMYSTQVELLGTNAQLMKIIYPSMLITGTTMTMYQIWPLSVSERIKIAIIETWYPIAIFYMLIFFSCFFVLVGKFATLQVGLFIINLMIASLLLGWRLALPLIIIGFYLAIHFYQYFFGVTNFVIQFGSPEFILIYVILFLGSAVIFFLKPKEEQLEQTQDKNKYLRKEIDYTQRELDNIKQGFDFLEKQFKQKAGNLKEKEVYLRDQVKIRNTEISKLTNMKDEFLRNITHESNTPMTGIISMSEVLYSCYDKLDNKLIKRTIKDIVNSSDRLKTYVNSVVDLSKLSSSQYKLNKEAINLGELAKERTFLYKKVFSDDETKQEFIFNIGNDFIINCDRYYITQTIDNLISNASNYGRGKSITISIKREEGFISFSISDQGIGIPETELLSIFAKFSTSSRTSTPSGGRGVGLALCKSVIEAHEGIIKATSSKGKGTIFTFTLPNVA